MKGGDRPLGPHCALGRAQGSHDEDAVRWKLWKTYKVLAANADDPRLTPQMHNAIMAIGNFLYGEHHGGN